MQFAKIRRKEKWLSAYWEFSESAVCGELVSKPNSLVTVPRSARRVASCKATASHTKGVVTYDNSNISLWVSQGHAPAANAALKTVLMLERDQSLQSSTLAFTHALGPTPSDARRSACASCTSSSSGEAFGNDGVPAPSP
jgi:hypothetical protein